MAHAGTAEGEESESKPDAQKPRATLDIAGDVAVDAAGEAGCCLAEAALDALKPDCFIATASLQPSDPQTDPDLAALRALRDTVLLHNAFGRLFTRAYYRWGRYPARAIRQSPAARLVVREALVRPLARLARWWLKRES